MSLSYTQKRYIKFEVSTVVVYFSDLCIDHA